jgi:hypothetical protein
LTDNIPDGVIVINKGPIVPANSIYGPDDDGTDPSDPMYFEPVLDIILNPRSQSTRAVNGRYNKRAFVLQTKFESMTFELVGTSLKYGEWNALTQYFRDVARVGIVFTEQTNIPQMQAALGVLAEPDYANWENMRASDTFRFTILVEEEFNWDG